MLLYLFSRCTRNGEFLIIGIDAGLKVVSGDRCELKRR